MNTSLRRFATVGLLCALAAAAALALLYRASALPELTRQTEARLAARLHAASGALSPHIELLLTQGAARAASRLRSHPSIPSMQQLAQQHFDDGEIVQVRLYDPSGRVVFSTDAEQIGEDAGGSPELGAARGGRLTSTHAHHGRISAFGRLVADRNLLQVYVPLRRGDSGEIIGVAELHADVTQAQGALARTQWLLAAAGACLVIALLAAVAVLARRSAPTEVDDRDEPAEEARPKVNEAVDRLVQERAELQRTNAQLRTELAERTMSEERTRELALVDSVTGLPNRNFFKTELERAIAEARRRDAAVAVMFLDLDKFKRINDTLGHTMGDELLRQAGARLSACVRAEDPVATASTIDHTLARLGGDEFTLFVNDIGSAYNGAQVAKRIIQAFSAPFRLGIQEVQVTPSIGIAYFPFDGACADTLLKNADTAMYHAKESGRNNYQFYSRSMGAAAAEKLELESRLRGALDRGEFRLHYQPRVSARTWRIVGVEALLRWDDPARGLVPPAKFVPLAEETGLIVPIGEWVLTEACRQNQAWRKAGLPRIHTAVNISSPHFRQNRLLDSVGVALRESGMEPDCLEIEVTESLIMDDMEAATHVLRRLKNIGVQVSIDDFGMGYSSFNYLKRFPVDHLKIDRSFIQDMQTNSDDAAITSAIIAMARILGLKAVAEGVENERQVELLLAQGCEEMQGYYFGKPLPALTITEMLRTDSGRSLAERFGHKPHDASGADYETALARKKGDNSVLLPVLDL
jgi:diguanylate cyclase (GGDEF)-like protein